MTNFIQPLKARQIKPSSFFVIDSETYIESDTGMFVPFACGMFNPKFHKFPVLYYGKEALNSMLSELLIP